MVRCGCRAMPLSLQVRVQGFCCCGAPRDAVQARLLTTTTTTTATAAKLVLPIVTLYDGCSVVFLRGASVSKLPMPLLLLNHCSLGR